MTPDLAPHVLTVADLTAMTTFDFTIFTTPEGTPCVLKCRRVDVLLQLLEGVVDAQLLQDSAAISQQVQAWAREPGGSFESAFARMSPVQKQTILEQLRRYACAAVVTPKLVMGDPQSPAEFPVGLVSAEVLYRLWNFSPPTVSLPSFLTAVENLRSGAEPFTKQPNA